MFEARPSPSTNQEKIVLKHNLAFQRPPAISTPKGGGMVGFALLANLQPLVEPNRNALASFPPGVTHCELFQSVKVRMRMHRVGNQELSDE